MKIPYEQLSRREALALYCDWIVEQLKSFNYAVRQIVAAGLVRAGAGAAALIVEMLVPCIVFIITQSNIIETMSTSGMKD